MGGIYGSARDHLVFNILLMITNLVSVLTPKYSSGVYSSTARHTIICGL
jgi:hypothetical protein